MARFTAMRTAGVEIDYNERESRPRQVFSPPHADEDDSSAERPDLYIPTDDRLEAADRPERRIAFALEVTVGDRAAFGMAAEPDS